MQRPQNKFHPLRAVCPTGYMYSYPIVQPSTMVTIGKCFEHQRGHTGGRLTTYCLLHSPSLLPRKVLALDFNAEGLVQHSSSRMSPPCACSRLTAKRFPRQCDIVCTFSFQRQSTPQSREGQGSEVADCNNGKYDFRMHSCLCAHLERYTDRLSNASVQERNIYSVCCCM